MVKVDSIYEYLSLLFPNPTCELVYSNSFELLVAVMLSAQTTDKAVNKVTKTLFSQYPDASRMSKANQNDVQTIIKPIGLSSNKAKNVIALSKLLVEKYGCIVPNQLEDLMSLPGVGRKTANVVLALYYNIPAIAVDTHVFRVSHRLGLSNKHTPLDVEYDLMKLFPKEEWLNVHHRLLFFGRYICTSKHPHCDKCKFNGKCYK